MTKANKAADIFGLDSTAVLALYSIIKPRIQQGTNSDSLIERRNAILNKRQYESTLQDLKEQGMIQHFFKEVLDVAKPKLVALQISEKQLEDEDQNRRA